jgi:predicted ribosome-associated RNA-binding protein Tma20
MQVNAELLLTIQIEGQEHQVLVDSGASRKAIKGALPVDRGQSER